MLVLSNAVIVISCCHWMIYAR